MPQDDITIRTRILGARAAAADSRAVGRSVGGIGKSAKETERHTRRMNKGFVTARAGTKHLRAGVSGLTGALGFGAGLGLIGAFKTAFDEATEATKATRQTQAVIKSTGGAANVTAKHVGNLSNTISEYAGLDDEVIQKGANMLLTFRNIRNEVGKGNDIFDKANRTLTDMAAATGQDNVKSAIQLGKALNDPVKGMTALQRVGVTFDDQQKKQIGTMVAHNNRLGAQKIVLKELNKEFGGSAKAQATPMEKLNVTLHNLAETVGLKLMPYINKGARAVAKFVHQMETGKGKGGEFVDTLKGIWQGIKPVIVWVGKAIGKVAVFASKHQDLVKLVGAVLLIRGAFRKLGGGVIFSVIGQLGKLAVQSIPALAKFQGAAKLRLATAGRLGGVAFGAAFELAIGAVAVAAAAYFSSKFGNKLKNLLPKQIQGAVTAAMDFANPLGQAMTGSGLPGRAATPMLDPRDFAGGALGAIRSGSVTGRVDTRLPRRPHHKLIAPPASLGGTGGAGGDIVVPVTVMTPNGKELGRAIGRATLDDRNRR